MAAFLVAASRAGVRYDRTITIGRQSVNFGPGSLRSILTNAGVAVPREAQAAIFSGDGYAEPFFRALGAEHIDSVDNSTYENASHVADLNLPVDAALKSSYSAVVDSGSTEHVFNYPQAIKNCMEMVAPGGHYLGIVPANNLCGHGFYQFSPEAMYRIFCEENGFIAERVYIVEQVPGARWLRAPDPRTVRQRVEYSGTRAAYIYVRAKRVSTVPIFATYPQQSDYVEHWSSGEGDDRRRSKPAGRLRNIVGGLPAPVKRAISNLALLGRRRNALLAPVDLFTD